MVSLKTEIGSISLDRPSMIASGIMDETGKSLVRVLESGAGAVVTKSIGLEPNAGHDNPCFMEVRGGYVNAMGLPNPGIELFKEEMEEVQWSVGAEYVYHDQFSLRAGYHHQAESKGNLKYFTVGGGFRMNVFSLDVGYVISTARTNPLDQTLRFTLAFDMDGIKDLFR